VAQSARRALIPSLLHVFWILHACHLLFAGLALRAWWFASPGPRDWRTVLWDLAPWLGLALLFWIPGFYLEWPSDPWDHLRRINEWHFHEAVLSHSAWQKSSYFLAYSLSAAASWSLQSSLLRLFYTGLCLLLAYQFYRLAWALGLGRSLAMVATLVACLMLGNSAFSFHRYYGLSSSILGEMAVFAGLRLALEAAARPTQAWRLAPAFLVLLGLAGMNHPQAAVTIAIGLFGIACWLLSRGRRRVIIATLVLWLLGNVAVALAWPRSPALLALMDQGWFSFTGGLDLLNPFSPAQTAALQVLGGLGCANLLAAFWMLRRNHPLAWICFAPVLLLLSPLVAIPLADVFLRTHQPMVVFQRLLLGIPAGLALVVGLSEWARFRQWCARYPAEMLTAVLLVLLVLPPDKPAFNRMYHVLMQQPADYSSLEPAAAVLPWDASQGKPVAVPALDFRFRALGVATTQESQREIWAQTPAGNLDALRQSLENDQGPLRLFVLRPTGLVTPFSTMGRLSGHWSPNHVASGIAGQAELAALAARRTGPAQVRALPGGSEISLEANVPR